MNTKLNLKNANNNSFITSNIGQSLNQNKSKTNSLSPDLSQIQKTKFIEYVNKKLITKSEDLKQSQIVKSKNSYNSSFSSTIQNKIKSSLTSTQINSTLSSNNINCSSTLNNYITGSKHNPISLISSNLTNNPNSSFNLKNSLNLGTQKTTQTLNTNIPIFINPTASVDNFKIITKKFNSKEKSFVGNINDPRFSNLETSDQEDELKLIASKKSEIEKKIFQLKKQVKSKSRPSNAKTGINKSITSTLNNNNNNINFTSHNDSFSNNLRTETINDKIIQNTFIQDNMEERKLTELINCRNNNDTFFSSTDHKLITNNNMMMIDTHLIPDEIFQNDQSIYNNKCKDLRIYRIKISLLVWN